MAKDKKVQWHPAFYGAMHLELKENKEDLEFIEEEILNTLPLRVDLLIIKKNPCKLQNEIGKFFKKYNLIEYKSPEDSLNYDVFLKGISYALLYKVNESYVDERNLDEITVTFVRERKPVKLLKRLKKEQFLVEESAKGIYYIIKKGCVRTQIVVSGQLSAENHIWLNSLSGNVNEKRASDLILTTQQLEDLDDKNYADSLWEVVATVNKQVIQKMREDEDMCQALAEIMRPEIEKAFHNGFDNGFNNGFDDGFDDGFDRGKLHIFCNMIKAGMSRELAQKYAEISDAMAEKALGEM